MPRRKKNLLRKIDPDPLYKSRVVTKLVNRVMLDGKKSVAQSQVYKALDLIKDKTNEEPLKVFSKGLENIKPTMEVRARRVGGAAYQVPSPVKGTRRESLAIRWLIAAAAKRLNSEYHTFAEKLAAEIIDATKMEGGAIKKKTDVERMAEANRAFAHFRW
ncbi:30S ribosomal protein S7 [Candidatus Woesebacteria bacterium RIFCSPLOWO2_01_FULL_39_61]|uniref:Small ribosomal subunit protein uS7 n=1 Tax=Candidatus Woesebacteria bacterium RIFCSPHIGHO2_02_FULL_39_13 TaxID=1802505 RepID=A0A1F7Z2L7_9BACT|nr:MAG: 30S ribosomal protein S7 [Candidatus Woesebacteria bacterium RIFCSPHIGHO2_01_FULL_39_95]OGM33883.1 MAG: 30S ribosomal protein S7 [Candidatus Woesebacteria bacterium RIFCSPHIGHO2_02_FULL_39_13]OGM38890.1 MAG: 30S ribosomal protein S7 [Candidatus Woesebacteria bacterium RIFCSPHIGHO2_12_FULL_40_20]OGM67829.1 MAG: 30S ribosomal protein S7 [Candidatus Woesebacteria bacterium RIFCSPLOWO2_01_FULL_39_61]OGM75381.1 MAG: 30S ribosomal protein S7 [Candidatus Woesebacteria bacterium RIFCSPLOWO2_12_